MLQALMTGFFLGISLILAIGAQNTFVLRQGILGQHVFFVALFCAISDSILITIGITGFSYFLSNLINEISNLLFGLTAIWLATYGLLRLKAAYQLDSFIDVNLPLSKNLKSTTLLIALFTFANPHVYLDTMILIGLASQQFSNGDKFFFGLGASIASFLFFFILAYSAKLLAPIMKKPYSWRIFDGLIAITMFVIAFNLARAGDWI